MKFTLLLATLLLLVVAQASGDEIVLSDGTTLTGTIAEQDRASITIQTEDGELTIDRLMVATINGAPATVENPRRPERPDLPPSRRGPEATEAMLEWIDLCIARLTSEDDGVRVSASAALRSAGDAARQKLEEAAAESDERVAVSARRLLATLDRRATARPTDPRTSRARNDARAVTESARASLEQLDLTSEQHWPFTQITREFLEKEASLHAARRAGTLDAKEVELRMQGLKSERDAKLAELLSDAQLEKLHEIEQAPKSRGR